MLWWRFVTSLTWARIQHSRSSSSSGAASGSACYQHASCAVNKTAVALSSTSGRAISILHSSSRQPSVAAQPPATAAAAAASWCLHEHCQQQHLCERAAAAAGRAMAATSMYALVACCVGWQVGFWLVVWLRKGRAGGMAECCSIKAAPSLAVPHCSWPVQDF